MWGGAPPRKPSLQTSKLPSFQSPLHPRHVRWTCQLNDAVESSGYALTYSGLPVARLSRVLFSVLCSPFSGAQSAPFLHPRHVCDVPSTMDDAFRKTKASQGMGTVERPVGPNGEVPRPLRSFVFLWETSSSYVRKSCRLVTFWFQKITGLLLFGR